MGWLGRLLRAGGLCPKPQLPKTACMGEERLEGTKEERQEIVEQQQSGPCLGDSGDRAQPRAVLGEPW